MGKIVQIACNNQEVLVLYDDGKMFLLYHGNWSELRPPERSE